MRLIANGFWSASLVVLTALGCGGAHAAELPASSAVDAVTVYPDGASVTRIVTLELLRYRFATRPYRVAEHIPALQPTAARFHRCDCAGDARRQREVPVRFYA